MTGHSSFPVERGMALVLVLWIVAALAVFASSLGGVVRQEAAVGGVSRNLATGRAAGEAAIYLALQRMATRPEALREPVLEPVTLPGGQIVEVEVVPWSGLVDINGATPELLAVLFQHAAGLSQGAAMAMAQTVRQARDAMRQQSGSAAGGVGGARGSAASAWHDLRHLCEHPRFRGRRLREPPGHQSQRCAPALERVAGKCRWRGPRSARLVRHTLCHHCESALRGGGDGRCPANGECSLGSRCGTPAMECVVRLPILDWKDLSGLR